MSPDKHTSDSDSAANGDVSREICENGMDINDELLWVCIVNAFGVRVGFPGAARFLLLVLWCHTETMALGTQEGCSHSLQYFLCLWCVLRLKFVPFSMSHPFFVWIFFFFLVLYWHINYIGCSDSEFTVNHGLLGLIALFIDIGLYWKQCLLISLIFIGQKWKKNLNY